MAADPSIQRLSTFLHLLSHPPRLRTFLELLERELDIAALSSALAVSASTSSRHVAMLRAHGLVEETRRGRRVFYRATKPGLDAWIREGLRLVQRDHVASHAFEGAPAND